MSAAQASLGDGCSDGDASGDDEEDGGSGGSGGSGGLTSSEHTHETAGPSSDDPVAGNAGGRTDEREGEHGNGDGGDSHSDDSGSEDSHTAPGSGSARVAPPSGAVAPASEAGAKGENVSSPTSAEFEGGVLTGAGSISSEGGGGKALVAASLSSCVSRPSSPDVLTSPRRRMSGRTSECKCEDSLCGVLHAAGACTNRTLARFKRCDECIQNEQARKAARRAAKKAAAAERKAKKAAAAKRKADNVCGCDGTCGRDGCRGGSSGGCKDKVTNSRARQCNMCRYAVEVRQKACATCGDKTSKGACSCVDGLMLRTKSDSTPEPDLLEGLLGPMLDNERRMRSVDTKEGRLLYDHFVAYTLLPYAARWLFASRKDGPVDGALAGQLRSSCVGRELFDRRRLCPYLVSALIRYRCDDFLAAAQLCILALEISFGVGKLGILVTCLLSECIGHLFPGGGGGGDPSTITFHAASGSMNPRLPDGLTRIQHLYPNAAAPARAARGAVGAAGPAATVNTGDITMPGILNVPYFVRALLVESLVLAVPESVQREAELDDLIVAEGKGPDEIARAFRALWATDPAPSPAIELEHFYSKRAHLPGDLATTVGILLSAQGRATDLYPSPRPILKLGNDTASVWQRALQHLLAHPPEGVESWNLGDQGSLCEGLAPVTQHESHAAMRGFLRATDHRALDYSCTCASCGTRVPATAASVEVGDDDSPITDLFSHRNRCRTGWRLSEDRVTRVSPGADECQGGGSDEDVGDPEPRGEVPLGVGDDVWVTPGDDVSTCCSDADELLDGDENPPRFRGRVTSVRRDGTFGVRFDDAQDALPTAPECPLTHAWTMYRLAQEKLERMSESPPSEASRRAKAAVDAAAGTCMQAAKACPFGSQLHGLHEEAPGELFILLRHVDWRPNRVEINEVPTASDVVKARAGWVDDDVFTSTGGEFSACGLFVRDWIDGSVSASSSSRDSQAAPMSDADRQECDWNASATVRARYKAKAAALLNGGKGGAVSAAGVSSASGLYVCGACDAAIRPKRKGVQPSLPEFSLAESQLQTVPACLLAHILRRDPTTVTLLPHPPLVLHQMVSAFRTCSTIIRLLSSSRLDRLADQSGRGASDAPVAAPIITGDGASVRALQQATRKHCVTFRNCIDEMREKVAQGWVDGPVSKEAVLESIKVVLLGPQWSKPELLKAAAACKTFQVNRNDLSNWLAFLEAFHLPRFYGPDAATDAVERQRAYAEQRGSGDGGGGAPGEEATLDMLCEDGGTTFNERCVVFSNGVARDDEPPVGAKCSDCRVSGADCAHCACAFLGHDHEPFECRGPEGGDADGGAERPGRDTHELCKGCEDARRRDEAAKTARFQRGVRGEGTAYAASHHDVPTDGSAREIHSESSGLVTMGGDAFREVDLLAAGIGNHADNMHSERTKVSKTLQCPECATQGGDWSCLHCACRGADHGHPPGHCTNAEGGRRPRRKYELCVGCAQQSSGDGGGIVPPKAKKGSRDLAPDIAMVRGDRKVNEFHENDLLSGANAPLFPNGRGLPLDARRDRQYTMAKWRKHLARLSNRTFARHHSFFFEVHDMESRHAVLRAARIRVTGVTSRTHKELGGADLKQISRDLIKHGVPATARRHPEFATLMRNLKAVGGDVPGSPYARGKYVNTLRGCQTVLGMPNVWVTINLHDLGDPHVLLFAGGEPVKIGVPIKKSEQARLIAADPFAAAEWFDTICKSLLKYLFGSGKGKGRGLFGTCEAFAAVKECYGRGSLHGHYLLWTGEITLLQALLRNPVERRRYESLVAAFVDSIVTSEVNAVPLHERTTEWCHPDAPSIADSQLHGETVVVGDEIPARVPTSDDIGRTVSVTMRPTRKTSRTFVGTVRSVCADGWYSVERASSGSSQGGDPRIRGADIDHTAVQLSSAAGVPLGELRCPLPPLLPHNEGDLRHSARVSSREL